ncbi:hypothetical protein CNMCM6069_008673 [Aspergillus lentulus]|nr:hypothetical protein CNMCM6069_008673 [Aspergillus lentulus]
MEDMQRKFPTWHGYFEFITTVPPPTESINFFSAQPSTHAYLQDTSAYQPIPFFSQYDKGDTSDTFFNETLRTAKTIPHALAVARKEALNLRDKAADEWVTGGADQPDYLLFVQLASGLNGYRDTVHGGVLASLLDEALGCCVEGFRQQLKAGERTALYTANLNVSYRAPVASPGVYVVKAWLARRDGRKWFLEAQVVGEDGRVRADVKSLWVSEKPQAVL